MHLRAVFAARFKSGILIALFAVSIPVSLTPVCAHESAPDDPYLIAAREAGVPLELLVAIAGAESGYHPYALNVDGRQVYCRSLDEAKKILAAEDNVDIGLMQINWPYWGSRLKVTKAALLDPHTNLHFGALILKQALARKGTIWRRISNYHSGAVPTRDIYNQRVYAAYLRYLHGEIQ
jgi:soluble lytic murein transglycosylase-like protein